MPALTPNQLLEIKTLLHRHRLGAELTEELFDHICCEVEAAMVTGQTFSASLQLTREKWTATRTRGIHRKIFYQTKLRNMLTKITLLLVLALSATTITNLPDDHFGERAKGDARDAANKTITYVLPDPPTASPIEGMELTDARSGYGLRIHPITGKEQLHRGLDMIAKRGTPVLATAIGRVTFAGKNGDYGIQVRIRHVDGYETTYAHLQEASVRRGDEVYLGQMVGKVGSTGSSTRPHLHYEILKDKKPVDPIAQFR